MVETGMIVMWPKVDPPAGWLAWDGSVVLKADYPALWAFLDPLWDENATQFRLGPGGGKFPASYDATSGFAYDVENFGGEVEHTLTTDEMPAHTHTQDSHNHSQDSHNHTQNSHNHTQNPHNHTQRFTIQTGTAAAGTTVGDSQVDSSGSTTAINQAATAINQAATATNQAATATNQAMGSSEAHNNLPPYFVTQFIIKT
jgi:microcystin-dependent protein